MDYGCSAQYNPNRRQTWVKHVGEQATKRFRFELKHLLQIKYERQHKADPPYTEDSGKSSGKPHKKSH